MDQPNLQTKDPDPPEESLEMEEVTVVPKEEAKVPSDTEEVPPPPPPPPSPASKAEDKPIFKLEAPPPPKAQEVFSSEMAISVTSAWKTYGKSNTVLSDFNMRVPCGTIYSLLGSSGCGKTTLLSCCVGIQRLDHGEIEVFGNKPGTKGCGVPGSRVGYMPQELSLYNLMTIQETFNFYGRIYGMTSAEIKERSKFLLSFLDLPEGSRTVQHLSGGQKRRVSIALALIHDPELLILDEPTVGVDPLLRESIWGHLVNLVTESGATVIITTHYVEEAKLSNVVGIMRNGRLLVEKSPGVLLNYYNAPSLEVIVLYLCRLDREERELARENEEEEVEENPTCCKMRIPDWAVNTFRLRRRKVRVEKATTVEEGRVVAPRYSACPIERKMQEDCYRSKLEARNGPPTKVAPLPITLKNSTSGSVRAKPLTVPESANPAPSTLPATTDNKNRNGVAVPSVFLVTTDKDRKGGSAPSTPVITTDKDRQREPVPSTPPITTGSDQLHNNDQNVDPVPSAPPLTTDNNPKGDHAPVTPPITKANDKNIDPVPSAPPLTIDNNQNGELVQSDTPVATDNKQNGELVSCDTPKQNGGIVSSSPPPATGSNQNGDPAPTTPKDKDSTTPTAGSAQVPTTNGKLATQKTEFPPYSGRPHRQSRLFHRILALQIKNFITLTRNVGFLIFTFIVPAVQVVLICLTIGSDPKQLELGVVNPEPCDFTSPNWSTNISNSCPVPSFSGDEAGLSCFFLSQLPVDSFVLQREATEEDALAKMGLGKLYGYIMFPKDYTNNVLCKFGVIYNCPPMEEVRAGSMINFEMDMSNKQIGQTMKRIFIESYGRGMENLRKNCLPAGVPEAILNSAADLPYEFKKPLYGRDDTSFREFLAPSILLGLLFFFPLCSSGVSYITEKKTGTLDRAEVAGLSTGELMIGFLITQIVILLGQAGLSFMILTLVFNIEILGSVALAIGLAIEVGISGMSAGFVIAMICNEEVQAVLLAIGTFFPNILLAGMVWPLEGMETFLQYFSYLLPCTQACESMRSIISRGWGFTHGSVWPGYATTLVWITVYWIIVLSKQWYLKHR